MADLKVRNLDDVVASALKARAKAKGVSLEEEVRRTLTASVAADRDELVRGQGAARRSRRRARQTELDSARHHPRGAGCLGLSPWRSRALWLEDHGRHQSA